MNPLYAACSSGSYSICANYKLYRESDSPNAARNVALRNVALETASGAALGVACGALLGPASAVAVPAFRSASRQGRDVSWPAEAFKVAGNVALASSTTWVFGPHVIIPALVFGASAFAFDSAVDRFRDLAAVYRTMQKAKL